MSGVGEEGEEVTEVGNRDSGRISVDDAIRDATDTNEEANNDACDANNDAYDETNNDTYGEANNDAYRDEQ